MRFPQFQSADLLPLRPHEPRPRYAIEIARVLRGAAGLPATLLHRRPRISGPKDVLVIPGFKTADASTLLLRRYLKRMGFQPRGWDLGFNRGKVERYVEQLDRQLKQQGFSPQRRVHLVGWSLGGVVARELARSNPQRVAHLVTMMTPWVGGPKYTATARAFRRHRDLDALEQQIEQVNRQRLPVSAASIFSRRDTIVHWASSIDPNPDNQTLHLESRCGHLEVGFSGAIFRELAELLARPLAGA